MADIKITGRMINFLRLTFNTNDLDRIRQNLEQICSSSDIEGALIVIQSPVEQELINLIQLLIEFKLQPMAVVDGVLSNDAKAIQFPIVPAESSAVKRIKATSQQEESEQNIQTTEQTEAEKIQTDSDDTTPISQPSVEGIEHLQQKHNTIYHDEMLRTGQCLIEEQGDIILTNSMNSGSEIIASGNVFIYGAARGRVIAGASGNPSARIFCHSLEAQLVSIAGTYCVADDIPKEHLNKAVQIHLNAQHELEFIPLT